MKKGLACHRTVVLDDLGLEFALVGRVSAHFDGHVRIDDVLLVIFHFGEVLSADHAEDQDLLHAKYHGPWQLISIQLGPHHSMGPINLSSAVPISQPEAISQPPDWNRELESRIGIENGLTCHTGAGNQNPRAGRLPVSGRSRSCRWP